MARSQGSSDVRPFVSAHPTARKAIVMTYVWIAIAVAFIPIEILGLDEGLVTSDPIDYVFLAYGFFALAEFTAIIAAIILFFLWFYRAYRNLPSLGATELEFSPRRAVIYFFVPILCLWKPFVATKEIWNVSASETGTSSKLSRAQVDTPRIVSLWWAFWVISNVVGWAIFRRGFLGESAESAWLYVASDILDVVSGLLTIRLIQKIDRMQATKSGIVNRQYSPPSDPVILQDPGNGTMKNADFSDDAGGPDFASQKP
jgi:hypothetical protein